MKTLRLVLLALSFTLTAYRLPAQQLVSDLAVQRTVKLLGDITPTQLLADANDYNPTGLSTATVLRLSSDASRTITGLAGGADGRVLVVANIGSNPIVLADESASSSAANRFALAENHTLSADTAAVLVYDSTSSRWRLSGGGGSATISDGDKGDVSVSASGATWMIDADLAKTWTGTHVFPTNTKILATSAVANLVLDSSGGSGREYELSSRTNGDFALKDATGGIDRLTVTTTGINSTAIGATTPSTGAFTALSASGLNPSLGGTSGQFILDLKGGNTGATDGSAIYFKNNSTTVAAIGNKSPIAGGGYSANLMLYTSGGDIEFSHTGTTVGTISSTGLAVTGGITATSQIGVNIGAGPSAIDLDRSTDDTLATFRRSGSVVGSIAVTTTATAFNTSSDARLKTNFRPLTNSGELIDQIRIGRYDWDARLYGPGHSSIGVLAQELHAVYPAAVTPGDSKAVDISTLAAERAARNQVALANQAARQAHAAAVAEYNARPDRESVEPPNEPEPQPLPAVDEIEQWAVDYSKLVPLLIAEVQSLRQRVAALETARAQAVGSKQ